MSDSQNPSSSSSSSSSVVLQQILDLFITAGYSEAQNSNLSVTDLLTDGLAWCIAAATDTTKNPNSPDVELLLNKSKVLEDIGAALRSIGCPYALQVHQIQKLDYNGIYSLVQWVVDRIQTNSTKIKNEVSYVMHEIEREEDIVEQLKKEKEDAEHSIEILNANLNEQNMRIAHILNASQDLRVKLDKEGDKAVVERLTLLLESLKVLENKESDSRSYCKQNDSSPQDDVIRLETKMLSYEAGKSSFDDFGDFSCNPLEKLKSAKTDLAIKLREVLSLKRQLDDVPSQLELIQYERRFTELNVQIQEKHSQTRKYYATYNALLEIKELVLKETSLLNSIISQFQDAITSSAGRMKLIDSLEGILKGTQQKLAKVQLGLRNEQIKCAALKEEYATLIAEQRNLANYD